MRFQSINRVKLSVSIAGTVATTRNFQFQCVAIKLVGDCQFLILFQTTQVVVPQIIINWGDFLTLIVLLLKSGAVCSIMSNTSTKFKMQIHCCLIITAVIVIIFYKRLSDFLNVCVREKDRSQTQLSMVSMRTHTFTLTCCRNKQVRSWH